jgi:DmsE family decaheme c-type cytochrome
MYCLTGYLRGSEMSKWKKILAVCATTFACWNIGAAHAAGEPVAADRTLKGDAVCTECHDENDKNSILAVYKGKHGVKADGRTPGCQTCHGASDEHVKVGPKKGEKGSRRGKVEVVFGAKSTNSPEEQNKACASCHEGGLRTHWAGSQHESRDVTCVSCHSNHVHQDKVLKKATQAEVCYTCHKNERSQSHKISTHPLSAGKIACSDCHNPHGSAGDKLLKKNTLNETCFTCHAEKRGPFLWEHQPVTESCASCHTPHGSNITPLLKSRSPFLCQECHDGPHNSKVPYGRGTAGYPGGLPTTLAPTENAAGRGCQTCHSMVHGSNHPAGALLHR